MNKIFVVRDSLAEEDYAAVIHGDFGIKVLAISSEASAWSSWVSDEGLSLGDLLASLPHHLEAGATRLFTAEEANNVKELVNDGDDSSFTSLVSESPLREVSRITENNRRFAIKSLAERKVQASPTQLPVSSFSGAQRQTVINYKALSYRSDSSFADTMINVKRARALWDPNLGPSGGYRCPPGSQYGGYITDRFGRGCGGGALRRVGRALINAGQGIESIGQRRDARRLERAAARAQRGENRRERVGAAARRGVAAVSNALERGAQRLVGEYQPRDYDPRTGRMRRRGIPPREISPDRRAAINSRLVEIADELNAIADGPRNPDAIRRERALVEENRRLRRERDGVEAQRVARVSAAPQRRRVVAREADRQRQRRQGARPVRKPVAERRRDGIMERAARRLVGEFRPSEYKPGDKERIRNRPNRYADVSDAQLRRALANNSPRKARPGEARNVEARRRQERLEILQEMVNRGLPIPEQYKREVAQYRLKPQRQRRREGLNRQGRAAVALERAAQRVEQRQQLGARRPAERRKPDALENQRRRIARARKNRPEGASDEEWNAYNEYLDSVPDGNFIPEGEAPQLEPVLSFGKWKRDVLPNMEPAASSNRPSDVRAASTRSQLRSVRAERANTSSLRRPQPKRQRGEQIDVEGMDRDQRARFRNIARDEKVKLDAEWRKRLGLKASDPITDAAIKKYIKDREDNKPGAYIGVLKAKGNDWKALDEYFKRIDNRPMAAAVAGENDLINRVGPKRRGEMVKAFNGPSSGRQRMIPRTPSPSSGGNRVPTAPSAPQAPNERPQNQRRYVPGAMGLNEVIELEQRPEFDFRGLPRALHLADFEVAVNALADSNQREKLEDMRKQLRRQANNLDAQMRKENDPGKRAKLLADFARAREEQDLVNGAIRRQIANAGRPVATPPAVVEEARDVQDAIARISGSLPDSRSRRNVRNRFPKQGLPQRAFWRNPDWVEAVGQADADEHERRFGRYYGPDNEINARGKLINEQLRNEREAVNAGRVAPQAPAAPTTSPARPAPRRPRQPRQPRTPAPSGQENNEAPAGAPNPGNALPRLRPVQPRKRAENMPVLGKDGLPDDPLPEVEHPGDYSIKTAAEAVAHLNNGLPLSDVPRELWWDALRENAKAPIGQRQFKRIAKNGGVIGDTVIYVAVDKKGKDLGQGFVLKADKNDPANNVAEVAGFQLAHALGIDIDVAGFDGSRRPGEMPVAIIPFAWNRAGEGGVITPNEAGLRKGGEIPNFDPRQFEGLADKAYPERLAGILVNYFLQMGDRHDQNHMGAMVDGRPMVVPIDLGWAGRFGPDMHSNFIDYTERIMWADYKLLSNIKTHLGKLTPEEKTRQADALKDVFDSMLGRAENIIAAGQQNYVDSILKSLSPEQRKNRNVVGAAQTKAANLFSVLTQTTENLRKRRDEVLNYFE